MKQSLTAIELPQEHIKMALNQILHERSIQQEPIPDYILMNVRDLRELTKDHKTIEEVMFPEFNGIPLIEYKKLKPGEIELLWSSKYKN